MEFDLTAYAKDIINAEIAEIHALKTKLGAAYNFVLKELYACTGKVIVIGVGKNAPIAQKMVATLNSTGTVAQFLHAGEALHGDLGIIQPEDICIIISKSGNTQEIKAALPSIKFLGKKTVAMTGNMNSYLASQADYVLDTTVSREAGHNNLAPTSSTTVQLVMCDAIAMTLMKMKNFTAEDFGKYHPGGSLGKQLMMRVEDILDIHHKPHVDINSNIKDVIHSLSSGRFGITVIMENGEIAGVVTDGDLRRMLEKYSDLTDITAKDIGTFSPKTIYKDALAKDALKQMNEYKIGQLIVIDKKNDYVGIIDFHGLINEGISEE
ncbi:KpsF/GutQ family sugar-phosphate isomerase [Flavobacteriaceae bacterium Ap0902]|nr:KpsF/GutQ family sugar-phosphate isomerase [Flavobacteriaceae bacterium Ap0902]